jgi:hypothetical protein
MKRNAECGMRNAEWAATGGGSVGSLPAFPLTPALSLRERESRRPSFTQTGRFSLFKRRDRFLPLPEGEAWGEGKGNHRLR